MSDLRSVKNDILRGVKEVIRAGREAVNLKESLERVGRTEDIRSKLWNMEQGVDALERMQNRMRNAKGIMEKQNEEPDYNNTGPNM